MNELPYHQSLRLENFTTFVDTSFEFVPGINVFAGENGTGKTHVMKAMYAMQVYQSRRRDNLYLTLGQLFQTSDNSVLLRMGSRRKKATVGGEFGGENWKYDIISGSTIIKADFLASHPQRPIYIPAIDMMGHTKGFLAAANEVVLDFDLTCTDLVGLLGLQRSNGTKSTAVPDSLASLLGGTLDYDESDSRFYLVTTLGRMPMPMVAEGLRKISTLVRLMQNGWLSAGATLFWDEPEVNMNPIIMDKLIDALLVLSRNGVQIFVATHSYVILKELDLQASKTDPLRYFSLRRSKSGTQVAAADELAALNSNPILEHYGSLYERDLDRAIGRERQRG